MPRTPDAERLDEEAPEADADWFARARPAHDVLPELFGADARDAVTGESKVETDLSDERKPISVALDADLVETFRSTGRGWQKRLNSALREWLQGHSPVVKS